MIKKLLILVWPWSFKIRDASNNTGD